MRVDRPIISITPLSTKRLKDGSHPVMLRLTHQGKRKYYSTKFKTEPSEWDKSRFFKGRNAVEKNYQLKNIEAKAISAVNSIYNNHETFTFTQFEKYFYNQTNPSFKVYTLAHIDWLIIQGRFNYATTFKDTLKKVADLTQRDLRLTDINEKFINDFKEMYLGKGRAVSSLNIHLINIRTILNKAIGEKLLSREFYPFKKGTIQKVDTKRKIALSKEDMDKFKSFQPEPQTKQWYAKYYFLISYYLRGMNLIDLLQLRYSKNVAYDRINFMRSKTGKEMSILMRKEISEIIKLFGSTNDYLIPEYTEGLPESTKRARLNNVRRIINSGLKEISAKLDIGIGQRITYYSARHTYAMTLKRANVPTSLISQGLGHAMEKTSKHYLDSFENEIMDESDKYLY